MHEMSTGPHQSPIAILRDAGREFWVLRQHFYEGVGYSLVEVGPTGIIAHATANGGGC
jgi:hypothetical protein